MHIYIIDAFAVESSLHKLMVVLYLLVYWIELKIVRYSRQPCPLILCESCANFEMRMPGGGISLCESKPGLEAVE